VAPNGTENPYARWLKVENDLCLPVITRTGLDAILRQVAIMVYQIMGHVSSLI
jgi:hypothetical protein